ncbi:hypothetical protein F5144DRAFT_659050 [Chaetomium tenue]|uniref:Uncharacterized protein n=1 Tax=Chaetomium tenue TaxID=1854479 RepID=A0ACB7P1R6_9PEZI|nr:hypothetical protein F5144DRAFT_659050 [Chaetomium globosum]
MGQPQPLRAVIGRRLLNVAITLTFIPLIVHVLLLAAGTFQIDDPSRPGARLIGLSSLSVVSFTGIIPSSANRLSLSSRPAGPADPPTSYLIHLQLFPNAFTFTHPTAPTANLTSGILQSWLPPSHTFDPLTHLHTTLPPLLSLPPQQTRCITTLIPSPPPSETCTAPYFTALHHTLPYRFRLDGHAAYLGLFIHFLSVLVVVYIFRLEVCVRYRPGWMRCQCWWRWARRVCPLPKGTREEVDVMGGERWDAARVWMYAALVGYGGMGIVWEGMVGGFLLRNVGWVEETLVRSGLGGKGLLEMGWGERWWVVSWGGVGAAMVALVCVSVRMRLMKGLGEEEGKGEPLLAKEGVVKAV